MIFLTSSALPTEKSNARTQDTGNKTSLSLINVPSVLSSPLRYAFLAW